MVNNRSSDRPPLCIDIGVINNNYKILILNVDLFLLVGQISMLNNLFSLSFSLLEIIWSSYFPSMYI